MTSTTEQIGTTHAVRDRPNPASKGRVAPRRPHVATKKAKSAKSSTIPKKAAKGGKKAGLKKVGVASDGSKAAKILELLKRSGGATLGEVMKVTNWQPHSVRAFISTLGKKMGVAVASSKSADGARSYSVKA